MKNNFMVTIGVNDLDKSVDFYQKILEFKLIKRFKPAENVEIAFLIFNNEIEIELIKRPDLTQFNNREASISLTFKTDNINKSYQYLNENQVVCFDGPQKLPTGISILRFSDPDGVNLVFVEE